LFSRGGYGLKGERSRIMNKKKLGKARPDAEDPMSSETIPPERRRYETSSETGLRALLENLRRGEREQCERKEGRGWGNCISEFISKCGEKKKMKKNRLSIGGGPGRKVLGARKWGESGTTVSWGGGEEDDGRGPSRKRGIQGKNCTKTQKGPPDADQPLRKEIVFEERNRRGGETKIRSRGCKTSSKNCL